MKTILRHDSRDQLFHLKFGQTSSFPEKFDVEAGLTNPIQPPGDTECTAITTTDIATDQNKVIYDPQDLFDRIPHDAQGAVIRDALGEACKNGLLPAFPALPANTPATGDKSSLRQKSWKSYWKCTTGEYDAFDNARSAMLLSSSSISTGTYWFSNWGVGQGGVMLLGQTPVSAHNYKISGWDIINGEPMFKVKPWLGYTLWMPRGTFNAAVASWGCGAYILSTAEVDAKRTKTIIQKILDAMKNVVILIRRQLQQRQNSKIIPDEVLPPPVEDTQKKSQ